MNMRRYDHPPIIAEISGSGEISDTTSYRAPEAGRAARAI